MIEEGALKAYKVRPDKVNSPWRVNYDSVIAHLERIHKINGLETRFNCDAAEAPAAEQARGHIEAGKSAIFPVLRK